MFSNGTFIDGTYRDGMFNNGTFIDGTFRDGMFNNGTFIDGTFKEGMFNNGTFIDGTFFMCIEVYDLPLLVFLLLPYCIYMIHMIGYDTYELWPTN